MLVTGILYAALALIMRTGDERCAHGETSGRISVAMGGGHDPDQYGENRHCHRVARFGAADVGRSGVSSRLVPRRGMIYLHRA